LVVALAAAGDAEIAGARDAFAALAETIDAMGVLAPHVVRDPRIAALAARLAGALAATPG
jgi:hypothetical protein